MEMLGNTQSIPCAFHLAWRKNTCQPIWNVFAHRLFVLFWYKKKESSRPAE